MHTKPRFLSRWAAVALSGWILSGGLAWSAPAPKTTVSIVGETFHLNGQPTYPGRVWQGHKIEGLLLNARLVQGLFDDLNPDTVTNWAYPDTGRWDAERNTREFLAAMPVWRQHGLLAFTINFQGGSPQGYSSGQPWHNSAFAPDGSLRPDFTARLERILNRADELGLVAIVGYFYFGQDERLRDEAAVVRATDQATRWLLEHRWRNVLVEVNNECNVRYDHPILQPKRVSELIERVRATQLEGRRLLVGTSYGGGTIPGENVVRASDFLLLHGNGVADPKRLAEMVRRTRAVAGYTPKPILFNEDDHFNFDRPTNNFVAAVGEYASWGYFDYRMKGEGFDEGYQSVPVNWGLSSPRKKAFFRLLAEITGANPGGQATAKPPLPAQENLTLLYDAQVPPTAFAAAEIGRALETRGGVWLTKGLEGLAPTSGTRRIVIASSLAESERVARQLGLTPLRTTNAQSYALRLQPAATPPTLVVLGADPAGAMYGGLDLAEAIRLDTLATLTNRDHSPYVAQRGLKFNLPLDLRTPSYSDSGDSFQANIPEVWSCEFWRAYLDEMARDRFNVLSLWSLHPFPSLVKVPEYPEVALNDVLRTKVKFDDTYNHSGSDMFRPALLNDVEIVQRLTIQEKIRFWREVMQMARDRGIDVYWFTWNIFTFGASPKYGITVARTNAATLAYFRASVREMVLTYPLLAGLGITAGEQMGGRQNRPTPEQWLWGAYGEGVRDALQRQPGRVFRLIHRFHMTGQGDILREFKDYPGPFDFSFKYSVAHMYSLTNPPFIQPLLAQLAPGRKTWLTVRNDDIYSFRWGDPTFARDYLRCLPPPDKLAGFYMGPDGYCWGREAIDLEPETPRQLVMQKQWYSFLLWGRLSYDPALPDAHFERILAQRFPEVPAAKLFQASATASRIIPQTTRLFWGDIDLRWFPEACKQYRHFYDVKDFITGVTMPGSGILNIRQWRSRHLAGQPAEGLTPLHVATNLQTFARETLALVAELRPLQGTNKELRLTLGDYEAMARLGHYYAEKILGACDLALFDQTALPDHQTSALRHLETALAHWKRYAAIATSQYKPQLLNRVGYTDLNAQTPAVAADLTLARAWKPGTVPDRPDAPRAADQPFRP